MKYLLSILICLCLSFSAKAQNTYHSMLEGNPEWSYYMWHENLVGENGLSYELAFKTFFLNGQKSINGKTYHCLYEGREMEDETVYCFGVREENGIIYADYNEFAKNIEGELAIPYEITPDSEIVLYDFTKKKGDFFYYRNISSTDEVLMAIEIESIDEVRLTDGSTRKRWNTSLGCYVDGIGSVDFLGSLSHYLDKITPPSDGRRKCTLNWFKQNGEYVYKAPDYTGDPSVEEESRTTFKKEDPFFDGEVNGIDRVLDDTPSSKPSDSAIYDLTGRRLNSKPERGIYIQGGKKYIAK